MTGHLLGGSGGIEAVACILALTHNFIPPTINYVNPDPECDLDYVPNNARDAQIRVALSNSFGFGGHNVCLALANLIDENQFFTPQLSNLKQWSLRLFH